MVPQAGAWPQKQSSHWGMKTRIAAAPEAAVVWSERPGENPGRSSDIAHQPKKDTCKQQH